MQYEFKKVGIKMRDGLGNEIKKEKITFAKIVHVDNSKFSIYGILVCVVLGIGIPILFNTVTYIVYHSILHAF